ncbi:aquaporin Z [Lysobacter sp. BMK333-48F3]|uniref:aquaporin Z n=1 Tax=Lysobacter sp. BMK333-48F3 TaxID=2867962 RepID=UPI001C8C3231|nr:aquaporin Z [Lysobacter sp. BMK333-48F3]MBX9399689.1 aquaporin Z [Lysobacter sp. BMK333-48F3]
MLRKLLAEGVGTMWLVLGGCGSAVLALGFPDVGIGLLGVSLAFGLSVLTAAYALGPISGAHFNPAVTVGLTVAGRFPARQAPLYVLAQLLGAVAGAALLYLIASGKVGFELANGLASNGYAERSPGGYSMLAALVCETAMTAMFLLIILGATSARAPAGFAPIAIGLALTLIHLVSIPVTNTSVNPARSTGPALLVGGWALSQLWLFWLAPSLGAVLAGGLWRYLGAENRSADPA